MISDLNNKEIRVRFGPSPTGFLHIGSARTTLFNWLFAKKYNGKFILRIEDTDKERSKKEYEEDIINGLKWLGFDYDEFYRQSERGGIYEKYLKQLLEQGTAYYCFCPKEELETKRQEALKNGKAPKYSGKCRKYSFKEASDKIKKGERGVIRFKIPEKEIEFEDLIRGKINFDGKLIGDIVIAKNLKEPLYNFSVAIDDYEMKISHVIRGEDHLANTPKQIAIFETLGVQPPQYAHLPLILAPDRSKMSKRYMETSLNEYKDKGYLKEAIINFLALLGWHSQDDQEIFSAEELIKEFDIKRIQKSGAVFNVEKLDWLDSQYIKSIDIKQLIELIKDFIPEKWRVNRQILMDAIRLERERIKKLSDFKEFADFFFELPKYDVNLLFWKNATKKETAGNLVLLKNKLEKIEEKEFNKEELEAIIMPLTEKHGKGELLWPLRACLSGKKASPGPFEIMAVLKKDETLNRLNIALKKCRI